VAVRHVASVPTVAVVPSAYSMISCAEYQGCVPYRWLPAKPRLPEYQPLPITALSALAPRTSCAVTSYPRYCRRSV
jgi:hypothetical protein